MKSKTLEQSPTYLKSVERATQELEGMAEHERHKVDFDKLIQKYEALHYAMEVINEYDEVEVCRKTIKDLQLKQVGLRYDKSNNISQIYAQKDGEKSEMFKEDTTFVRNYKKPERKEGPTLNYALMKKGINNPLDYVEIERNDEEVIITPTAKGLKLSNELFREILRDERVIGKSK